MNGSRPTDAAVGNFCASVPVSRISPAAVPGTILVFVAFCLFICAPGLAQSTVSIEGHVYDASDGHPIRQAEVRIESTDYATRTDPFGGFLLEHIPAGSYRLEISAGGYHARVSDEIAVTGDFRTKIEIFLHRNILEFPDRVVRGRSIREASTARTVIDRDAIERSGAGSLGEVLQQVEGIYIQEAGPAGGGIRISIRGYGAGHVLVLLDGQRINPAGSGEADLSTIPLEMVEKIEVYRGGESARYGADAVGGVVSISTSGTGGGYDPEIRSKSYWGKWKTSSHHVTALDFIRLPGLSSKLAYGFQETSGDFFYNYSVNPDGRTYSGIRRNDDTRTHNYFVSAAYRFGAATMLAFSGHRFQSRLGLPGGVSSIDTTAWKEDTRILGTVRLQHALSDRVDADLEIGVSRFEQYFNNVDHPYSAYRFEDHYTNDLLRAALSGRYRMGDGPEVKVGMEFQRDRLYHDNLYRPSHSMPPTVRDGAGVYVSAKHEIDLASVPFWQSAVIDVSVRWDNSDTRYDDGDDTPLNHVDQISRKVGLSISRGERRRVVLRSSYGTSFRLPSINALFWKSEAPSGANPELRPERAEHSEVGAEVIIDGAVGISAGLTYFHSFIRDVIVWQPAYQQVWTPKNLAAALLTGHEDYLKVRLFNDRIRLTYKNTILAAKNREPGENTYDKILTYRPRYVTNLECSVRYGIFRGSYNIRLVDKRYSTPANTKWYDAYRVEDIDLGVETKVSRLTLGIGYRVKNIRGEEYELIAHYPMPGREWGMDVALTYRL